MHMLLYTNYLILFYDTIMFRDVITNKFYICYLFFMMLFNGALGVQLHVGNVFDDYRF